MKYYAKQYKNKKYDEKRQNNAIWLV